MGEKKKKQLLDVSCDEFLRSRNRQESVARKVKDDSARRMLLFYAVECGGKYQLMRDNNCFLFSNMPEEEKNYLHDIKKILKRIGLEQKCKFPNVKSKRQEIITPAHYQEMWRYGISCEEQNQLGAEIEENLNKALHLLRELEGRKGVR